MDRLVSACLLLVASVAVIYLSISSNAGTAGRESQILQTKIEDDQRNIADKKFDFGLSDLICSMNKRAAALGFQPVDRAPSLTWLFLAILPAARLTWPLNPGRS